MTKYREVVVTDDFEAQAVNIEIDADEYAAERVRDVVQDIEQQNDPGVFCQAVG